MILIYLEDRRSTSKMLQNVRYIVMNSISIFPKMKTAMDKLIEPIRSPLQLYLIKRLVLFAERMKNWTVRGNAMFGSIKFDYVNHMFLDKHGGSNVRLFRPLIIDEFPTGEFSEILCEMYFTMLFNKNQDDPTHASFQILEKILEGEKSYEEAKDLNMHLGYGNLDDVDFAKEVINKAKTHMFSSRAIEVGSRLLRQQRGDVFADEIISAAVRPNMNKTLDEFATYKSSSTKVSEKFDPKKTRQNPRRRCIEGVLSLLEEGCVNSFDVVNKYRDEETYYHVFKKNQIGGVREILILPMTNRIRINVLETLSRNICFFDQREILTHGQIKNEAIKACLYSAKKLPKSRAQIHITMDKTKWGPSFVPIQFIYLFTSFKEQLGDFFPFIMDLLIKHQNKKCCLPDRLVTAWDKDVTGRYQHKDPNLQKIKKLFNIDKRLVFRNHSNMGQGILHFTSSLLHLCMIQFRDELYKRMCKKMGLDDEDHQDLLSSDDSYTLLSIEIPESKKGSFALNKLNVFLKAQRVSELLFNCRTSLVKSSVNPLIGEFNSLFISNMTFMPTLMKFALASVHPVNTDSFYRMVKESYSSCRQIVENGGGLDLYLIASKFNKKYCELIYHTDDGSLNNLSNMGIRHIPYHLGNYPIFNPALMVMFGPEYHNYHLYKKEFNEMNEKERTFFMSSHKIIKGGLIETLAEFEDGDTILGGLLRIEANLGPIKQLLRIRDSCKYGREFLEEEIQKNPLLIVKRPEGIKEVLFRTVHKLYTKGASEAMKNIAASIYYGRVAASVSANAYYIPNHEMITTTYRECLEKLVSESVEIANFDNHIKFLYPRHSEYEAFFDLESVKMSFSKRNPFEIQTVQSLSTHRIHTKLNLSVPDILESLWLGKRIKEGEESKFRRDYDIITTFFPLIKPTLQETMNQFSGEEKDKLKAVLLLILKLFSLRDRTLKGVVFGMSSNDLFKTFDTLIELNSSIGYRTQISLDGESHQIGHISYEPIYLAHNHQILSNFSNDSNITLMWDKIDDRVFDIFLTDNNINRNTKKRVFMCLASIGRLYDIESWTKRTGIILHHWIVRQKFDGSYSGDYKVVFYSGLEQMVFESYRDSIFIKKTENLIDPERIWSFISEFLDVMSLDWSDVERKLGRGNYHKVDLRINRSINNMGFNIGLIRVSENISFDDCELDVDDKRTTLVSSYESKLFSVETGLINTFATCEDEDDFEVFGMRFKHFCEMGIFNQNFSLLFKERSFYIQFLTDLRVDKPFISTETINKLSLRDWDKIKVEEEKESFGLDDFSSFMTELIDFPVEKLPAMNEQEKMEDMIDFLVGADVVNSMQTAHKIQHTRRIFKICQNVKYDIISYQFLLELKLNAKIIRTLSKILLNYKKEVLFSLISLYDRLNLYLQSPKKH